MAAESIECWNCDRTNDVAAELVGDGRFTCACGSVNVIHVHHDPEWGNIYFGSEEVGDEHQPDPATTGQQGRDQPSDTVIVRDTLGASLAKLVEPTDYMARSSVWARQAGYKSGMTVEETLSLIIDIYPNKLMQAFVAELIFAVLNTGLKAKALAVYCSIPVPAVSRYKTIAQLAITQVKAALRENRIPFSGAYQLSRLPEDDQDFLLSEVLANRIKVADIAAAQSLRKRRASSGVDASLTAHCERLSEEVSAETGLSISIRPGTRESGQIVIEYWTLDVCDDVLERLKNRGP